MTSRRFRVLLVVRNFPPILGGMERLLHHVYLEIARRYDVLLVGPRGCGRFVPPGTPVAECPLFPLSRFLARCQWEALRMGAGRRPDLVLSGSGLTAPAAWLAARAARAPMASMVYGLDLVATSTLYRAIFLPAIRRADGIIAISRNTSRLAVEAGVRPDRVAVLHPGVEIPPDRPRRRAGPFRDRLGIGDAPLLLSVGRLTPRKGLPGFVRRVMPSLAAGPEGIRLAIIGDEPQAAAAGRSGERARIEGAIAETGLQDRCFLLGFVDEDTLRDAYREADILVFPVRDLPGDVEGFGMVAVEAAARGLPTVAYAAGGVPDAVEDGVSGYLVPPGDEEGFARAIRMVIDGEDPRPWHGRCREFARRYSWDRFGSRLREICEAIIADGPGRRGAAPRRRGVDPGGPIG